MGVAAWVRKGKVNAFLGSIPQSQELFLYPKLGVVYYAYGNCLSLVGLSFFPPVWNLLVWICLAYRTKKIP